MRVRELDMRASPYDLRELGYEPVPIETPEDARTTCASNALSRKKQPRCASGDRDLRPSEWSRQPA